MRASNRIAVSNATIQNRDHPVIKSFQNIIAARAKLLPHMDMGFRSPEWNRYVLIFQKRHLFAHTLGVADSDYVSKSGDTVTPLGKMVSLTKEDVVFFADYSERIVKSYFGSFLS